MAEENVEYDLLEDIGEEVDYDDFTLEDEDYGDIPADFDDAPLIEEPTAGKDPKTESAPPAQEAAAQQSTDEDLPLSATTTTLAVEDKPQQQPCSKEQQQKIQAKKTVTPKKAGVKKPQAQGEGQGPGRGRRDNNLRGRGSVARGRLGDRSGRGRENGREHLPRSGPPSRHGTPPLSGVMQMPGASMAGLPMPPAMMMHGPGQGPPRPMGGPPRMQGPPMQQGMPRPPPRPLHQGMDRGPQPQPPANPQNQRPREPIRWQQPPMEDQHGMQQRAHMERQHQHQLDMHMGPQHPRMERAHPHEPPARMLPGSAPALPFPPGMGNLLKQRLDMGPAGMPGQAQPRLQMNGKQPSKEGLQLALGMDTMPQMRGRQGPGPGQPHSNLLERLNSPLGAGQRPALGALMRAGESAEELRLKEERLEQERAAQRRKEAEAKRKAEELKVKKLEMAKLRIQLQQAENRNIMLKREAEERERKAREAAEFEAMKLRVRHLELLVAENAAINPAKAQEASAALPEAKAAAAKAAAAVAAPRAAPQPAPVPVAALQVDFDDEEEEEVGDVTTAVQQPKAPRAGRPLAAAPALSQPQRRPKAAGVTAAMAEAAKQQEKKRAEPRNFQERLSARPEKSKAAEGEQRKPAPFEDLRELIRKKRALDGGERDEGRIDRPSIRSRISQK